MASAETLEQLEPQDHAHAQQGEDQYGNTFAGHQTKIQMKDFKR